MTRALRRTLLAVYLREAQSSGMTLMELLGADLVFPHQLAVVAQNHRAARIADGRVQATPPYLARIVAPSLRCAGLTRTLVPPVRRERDPNLPSRVQVRKGGSGPGLPGTRPFPLCSRSVRYE
jgi:hypothetical protein